MDDFLRHCKTIIVQFLLFFISQLYFW